MTLNCICIHDLGKNHEREFEITVPDNCEWYDIERAAKKAHGVNNLAVHIVHIEFPHNAKFDVIPTPGERLIIKSPMKRVIVWVRHLQ